MGVVAEKNYFLQEVQADLDHAAQVYSARGAGRPRPRSTGIYIVQGVQADLDLAAQVYTYIV